MLNKIYTFYMYTFGKEPKKEKLFDSSIVSKRNTQQHNEQVIINSLQLTI